MSLTIILIFVSLCIDNTEMICNASLLEKFNFTIALHSVVYMICYIYYTTLYSIVCNVLNVCSVL